MRRTVTLLAAGVVLAGPTVLAFFSGGYFDGPRLVAGIVAWALVLVAVFVSPRPLPASWPGRMALAGLALMWAWTLVSISWAPLAEPAADSGERLLLYLGALTAAAALLSERRLARAVEPALAAGALVVIGYGLSGRLLPGVIHLDHSAPAGGRLEQPLTYWNAEGALAAMGLALCARLAGDPTRPAHMRIAGGAAAAPLGMGVYLSYSRGAIAAGVLGLVVLLAAAPTRSQLRGIGVGLAGGLVAGAVSAAFPGVASLEGGAAARELDGGLMLAILAGLMAAAGFACARIARAETDGALDVRPFQARRLPAVAAGLVALTLAGLLIGGLQEKGGDTGRARNPDAARLTSLGSRRYDYWRIGREAFFDHPLKGVGAAGFRVLWLRQRPVEGAALDVHSLELELATELGLVGLLPLGLLLVGVGVAGARTLRRDPALLAGGMAAAVVWVVHASFDWDWQMPAVSLPALVIAGALIAASESPADRSA